MRRVSVKTDKVVKRIDRRTCGEDKAKVDLYPQSEDCRYKRDIMKNDSIVRLRVPSEELQIWRKTAAGRRVSLSKWIRWQCSGVPANATSNPEDYAERVRVAPIIEHHTKHHERCPCVACVEARRLAAKA
jgi:hypothetical protein